jgi:hypothetical protein
MTIDQTAILLDYIRRNQPCTIGEALAESGCGCMDKGVRIIKGLVTSGKLLLDSDGMTLRLLG